RPGPAAPVRLRPAARALPGQDGHVHPAVGVPRPAAGARQRGVGAGGRSDRLGPRLVGDRAVLARRRPLLGADGGRGPRRPRPKGPGMTGGGLSPDFLTDLFRDPLDPGYAAAARRRASRPEPPGWRRADAPPPVDPVTGRQTGTNPGLVLDRDLQDVANELWHDGAEAIAINGQRLTATTTIRAAGGAILVDFRPVTAPYQVSAIGPDDL